MGKSSPSPPPAPDPNAVAQAQTGTNVGTAIANTILGNANRNSPYGSTTFNQIGNQSIGVPTFDQNGNQTGTASYDIPRYEENTHLAPAQQQMLDLQNKTSLNLNQTALDSSNKISGILNQGVDTSHLPSWMSAPNASVAQGASAIPEFQTAGLERMGGGSPLTMSVPVGQQSTAIKDGGAIQGSTAPTNYATSFGQSGDMVNSVGPQNFSADRQAVTDSLMARMQPQLDHDRQSLQTQIINQGFTPGTEAYDRQMDSFNRQSNDAYSQAVLAGGQEQSRLAGLQLNQANFANSAQQQGYSQAQGRGMFGLQATQAQDASNLAAGNFANQAQAQRFGQNQAQGMFGNSAIGANNAANISAASFGNQAAGQQFVQDQSRLGFNNDVATQGVNAANQNSQQTYTNAMNNAQFNNANAQTQFNNQLSQMQANNSLRGQQLQEQYGLQSFPINQITALMSGGQVQQPQNVGYNGGQVAQNNVSGDIYNTAAINQQNYQSQLAQQNAFAGGLFGLGGAALGAVARSDRRLKRDIIDTGVRLMNGLKLYAFKYLWDNVQRVGVMAQDVMHVLPAAVHSVDGYGVVDYDMVMEAA